MNRRRAYWSILMLAVAFASLSLPEQSTAQSKKGIELYSAGQFKKAEAAFQDALKTNPSDIPNSYYLGLSILLQDRYREALDVFLKVKQDQDRAGQRTRPPVPDAYQINLAMARARLGLQQYPDAWKNLESARVESPASSDVYVYRGVYYLQQEKLPEAIKELEKAISLDSKNAYAYYYAGLAYYKSSQPEKAVDALKMFLQLDPDAPEAPKAKEIVTKLC